ncbi:MAG: formylglycine-generating enzyme family protein [Candidatus Omnitrophota bacterium]
MKKIHLLTGLLFVQSIIANAQDFTPTPTRTPDANTETPIAKPVFNYNCVIVTDDKYSAENLCGLGDYDLENERELALWWKFPGVGTEPCKINFHIYVRDYQSSTKFELLCSVQLIDCPFLFSWIPDNPIVEPKFRNGPQFGHEYKFRAALIDKDGSDFMFFDMNHKVQYVNALTLTPTPSPITPIPTVPVNNIIVTDDRYSFEDLTQFIRVDYDSEDERELVIRWDLEMDSEDYGCKDFRAYVSTSENQKEEYLGHTGSGEKPFEIIWAPGSSLIDEKYRDGPQFGVKYYFNVRVIATRISNKILNTYSGNHPIYYLKWLDATSLPTPLETPNFPIPSPTWNSSMPSDRMIVTDNQYTYENLDGWLDYDTENDRELVLRWNPNESEKTNLDIVDYYVQLSINKSGFEHLGHTNSSKPPYIFAWKAGSELVSKIYRNGPAFGNMYNFHVFPVTKSNIIAGYGYYNYNTIRFMSGTNDYPRPTSTKTPLPSTKPTTPIPNFAIPFYEMIITDDEFSKENLCNKTDYDYADERELVLWWNMAEEKDYLREFQIFVNTKDLRNREYLGSTWQIEKPYHFVWKPNAPWVDLKFRHGPEFGHLYSFVMYYVDKIGMKWGSISTTDVLYTGYPNSTPHNIEKKTTPMPTPTLLPPTPTPTKTGKIYEIYVFDEPGASEDLSGKCDFDFPDDINLTISWETVITGVQGWDVYVRQDGLGYQFLAHCSADETSWDWRSNAPNVNPAYRKGPQFNHTYQFRVYPLGVASGPQMILEQSAPVLLLQEGEEPAPMPTIPIPDVPAGRVVTHTNLMKGNIPPPMDWLNKEDSVPDGRAILIAWNFGEDSALIKDYHIRIKVGEMDGNEFLGSTGSGEISYFEWSPKSEFYTSPAYREGPQKGKCYRFRIVGISSDGVKRVLESDWILNSEMIVQRIPLPNMPEHSKPLDFILIKAGTFLMGSPMIDQFRREDETQHEVTITKDFYIGKYEVTQEQWRSITQYNPYSGNYPIDSVSWYAAQAYAEMLSQLGLGKFRLPTEAEWEYACRAGTSTRLYWGDDEWMPNEQSKRMNYYVSIPYCCNYPVGLRHPNAWGLFDMSGNVYEWCQDWYGPYEVDICIDPAGAATGILHVCRGGGKTIYDCRSAYRYYSRNYSYGILDYGYASNGLRLVWEPDAGTQE